MYTENSAAIQPERVGRISGGYSPQVGGFKCIIPKFFFQMAVAAALLTPSPSNVLSCWQTKLAVSLHSQLTRKCDGLKSPLTHEKPRNSSCAISRTISLLVGVSTGSSRVKSASKLRASRLFFQSEKQGRKKNVTDKSHLRFQA